jgi:hypothetical protein
MGTRKNFAENYRKLRHALSKGFASPGLGRQEIEYFYFRYAAVKLFAAFHEMALSVTVVLPVIWLLLVCH